MRTITIEIRTPEFGDEPPDGTIPDGATGWEAQTIRAAWIQAHRALAALAESCAAATDELNAVDGHPVPPDGQTWLDARAAIGTLRTQRDATLHRLAAERRRAPENMAHETGTSMVDTADVTTWLAANPDLVLAALVESGWRPTYDDLRAMGLELRTDYEHLSTWRFPKEATDES